MKRGRVFAVLVGGVFCVALMSLYRMLEVMQRAELRPRGDTPPGQVDQVRYASPFLQVRLLKKMGQSDVCFQDLLRLQQKIDRLEGLLSENNRLVAALRDSLELKDGADGVQLLDVYDLLAFDNPDGGAWKQGFDISYRGDEWDEQPLEVFLVPHSHNDPGWLKTFDGYYEDQTRHILNNMVTKLSEDSRRKMIWAEISYFSKWWSEIDEQKRSTVKRLVGAGQLELVTGGWVMPDEASTHYFALLDQLLEGHQWLQTHLGVTPSSGWAIDPFGHSPSMTYLLKGAGLKNMVIQRIHYAVKKHFARQKSLEFLWRQSWDSSPRSDITCHMMPFYSYDVPHTCGPNPAVCCQFDFHRLPGRRVFCPWRVPPQPITEQNVQERALLLLDQYRQKSLLFRTPVLLVPLGDDFRFVESSEWDVQLSSYQRLFDYYQQHPELRVTARFGTLSDYFQSLHRRLGASGVSLPSLRGDFFTYADRDDHYWSGFFSSRPFYKRLDRVLEATLRATEILFSLTLAEMRRFHGDGRLAATFPAREHFARLTSGRRSLALFQHHDAVTGTARDPVVVDYGTRLLRSLLDLRQVLRSSAHWLLLPDRSRYRHDVTAGRAAGRSLARSLAAPLTVLSSPGRSLVVFNPTQQVQTSVVTVLVDRPDARVSDARTGTPVPVQMSAVWAEPGRPAAEAFQLSFVAALPPLALTVYQVTAAPAGSAPRARYTLHGPADPAALRNPHFQVSRPPDSEEVRLRSGLTRKVQVQFLWYGTRTGSNRDKSGAYLFLPGDEGGQPYRSSEPPLVRVSRGPIFSDITSCYKHFTHTLRLFHLEGHAGRSLEISNMVDIRSESNRELVMRLVSDVANGNRFYSDLNGFQMQQRRLLAKLPLQAHFYPMTAAAFLQDAAGRLTLLAAQSQGVAALRPGQLEVVLDRRLLQDDNRGLGQGVTDNKVTASLYRLLLEERGVGGASEEHLSLLAHLDSLSLCQPPITMVTRDHAPQLKLRPFLPLSSPLPCDIHLLNLRTLEDDPSQEVALLLHRKGFHCDYTPEPKPACTWSAHEKVDTHTDPDSLIWVQNQNQNLSQ
uniref:Alpha-mannosidase n=1 Tax=Salarias fasciatus TaxID=181472 RepID=A0A672ID83_SALFA